MRKQAEGLTKEYDRLLEEYVKVQVPWEKKGWGQKSIWRREWGTVGGRGCPRVAQSASQLLGDLRIVAVSVAAREEMFG